MKTAISIPDDIFRDSDRLARRLGTSRSRLYARAMADFLARHGEDEMTQAMNRVIESVGSDVDGFVREAGRETLHGVEW